VSHKISKYIDYPNNKVIIFVFRQKKDIRGIQIKQKKTLTEYNLLNYCILLLKDSSYGAIFRNFHKNTPY